MSSRFHQLTRAAAIAGLLVLSQQAWSSRAFAQSLAQSTDDDPEMRIQRLEEQLRQLTGQNEELQYRNRQLEDRLRQLQGGAQPAPGAPSVAAAPPVQAPPAYSPPVQGGGYAPPQPGYAPAQTGYGQSQPGYGQQPYGQSQIAAPAPIVQEPPAGQRRGDAFDPNQNPSAPGAPRPLGGGQLPVEEGAVAPPGGRPPG
ncbi:septum formation initiator family protein, partial [Bradyrhizobium sp.]|uniref:septum formation initiator family protein n=1 Tax=Bradyrhizobium sp. TaxID=376 RepID=UPI003C62653D